MRRTDCTKGDNARACTHSTRGALSVPVKPLEFGPLSGFLRAARHSLLMLLCFTA